MLNDTLIRLIGSFMINPRVRQRITPSQNLKQDGNRILYPEDKQMADLFAEFSGSFTEKDMQKAYTTYLGDICTCIDAVRPAADKISGLKQSEQINAIAEIVSRGPGAWQTIPGFTRYQKDLQSRDINAVRAAMVEALNTTGSATLPVIEKAPLVSAFRPVGRFAYDSREISLADTTIRQATHRRFSSTSEILEHLFRAEAHIEYLRTAQPIAPVAEGDLRYEVRRIPARDLFIGATTSEMGPQDLNFEVDTFVWTNPHPKVPAINPSYVFRIEDLFDLLYCVDRKKNCILVGPTGCGKTDATEQLAARLGRPFYRIPMDGQMRKREILGGFKQVVRDGHSVTEWYDGLVPQAMAWPSIMTLDEIDRGDPDLQYVAHALYEGNGMTILEDEGRHIVPNEYFSILATANTKGRAEGMNIYSLSTEMSEATRDRFPFMLDWDYLPAEVEKKLLLKVVDKLTENAAAKIVKIANGLRAALVEGKIRTAASFRQVRNCAEYAAFQQTNHRGEDESLVLAVKKVFVGRATDEGEIAAVKEIAKAAIGDAWEQANNRRP